MFAFKIYKIYSYPRLNTLIMTSAPNTLSYSLDFSNFLQTLSNLGLQYYFKAWG